MPLKAPPLKVITANRLIDGRVVYLTRANDWSRRLADAWPAEDEAEAARLLDLAEAHARARRVVGVYAFPVVRAAGGFAPVSQRERIRMLGPSLEWPLPARSA